MKIIFEDNPDYKKVFTTHSKEVIDGKAVLKEVHLYTPSDVTKYHLSRMVAANAQNIYSNSGITKQLLSVMLDNIIEKCNDRKAPLGTILTDIALIAQNLKYRTKYPIDEDCALRMGAIYTFIDGENPEDVSNHFTQMKVNLAKEDAALYDFFINSGIKLTPAYQEYLPHLSDTEYFQKRSEIIQSMTP